MKKAKSTNIILEETTVEDKIYSIRNMQVMLDSDIAALYGVETKRVNEAVKNNPDKFPKDFMFELTVDELENLRSKFSTSSWGGRRYSPKVFTEQGVYMLATIVKSKSATQTTIAIMRTFTKLKAFISSNASLFDRFERIEQKLYVHEEHFNKVFKAIEDKNIQPIQGVFCDGQIYDAYKFVNDVLKSAKKEVVLIDNYIDDTVLTLFSAYPSLKFTIITKSVSKKLGLDINKYNAQYNNLTLKRSSRFHDRFLIIDETEAWHIGASLKDLGKKVFAFSKIEVDFLNMNELEVLDDK